MLVRLISDLYYDTPENSIGYVIRKLKTSILDENQDLYLVRFTKGTEEVAEFYDLEIIQEN